MSDCLFCTIATGGIPVDVVYEDDQVLAFRDIDPQAPTHVLVIPREHFDSVSELTRDNPQLAADVLAATTKVAQLDQYMRAVVTIDDGASRRDC